VQISKLFTKEQLSLFEQNKDTHLGDTSLISTSKKHLVEKFSPLAIVHMLRQKHQAEIEIIFDDEEITVNTKNGMTKEWTSTISIASYPSGLKVSARETSKQKSR